MATYIFLSISVSIVQLYIYMSQTLISSLFSNNDFIYFSAAASVAAGLTAFLSFLSIRQMRKFNEQEHIYNIKAKTIDYVGDSEVGIASLSRKPHKFYKKHYSFLGLSSDEIIKMLKLDAEHNQVKLAMRHIQSRTPMQFGPTKFSSAKINKMLVTKPFVSPSEADEAISKLMNKMEDIANGVNTGLLDIDLIDFMYGGMISTLYRRHSEWISFVKRIYGFRTYDQFDTLIDKLLYRSCSEYSFFRFRVIVKLFFCGSQGRNLAWNIVRHSDRWKNHLSRNAFMQLIERYSLNKHLNFFSKHCLNSSIFIDKIRPIAALKKNKRMKQSFMDLFHDCIICSNGVWPVGLQYDRENNNKLDQDVFNNWYGYITDYTDYFVAANNSKKRLIGFIGISGSQNLQKNASRWQEEIFSALQDTLSLTRDEASSYLSKLGVPVIGIGEKLEVDLQKVAMLKTFYVHQDFRKENCRLSIGRLMLRRAISFCRNELNCVPMLTVLADTEFTEKAISLYVAEGASYLGFTFDAGDVNNHKVHVFIF